MVGFIENVVSSKDKAETKGGTSVVVSSTGSSSHGNKITTVITEPKVRNVIFANSEVCSNFPHEVIVNQTNDGYGVRCEATPNGFSFVTPFVLNSSHTLEKGVAYPLYPQHVVLYPLTYNSVGSDLFVRVFNDKNTKGSYEHMLRPVENAYSEVSRETHSCLHCEKLGLNPSLNPCSNYEDLVQALNICGGPQEFSCFPLIKDEEIEARQNEKIVRMSFKPHIGDLGAGVSTTISDPKIPHDRLNLVKMKELRKNLALKNLYIPLRQACPVSKFKTLKNLADNETFIVKDKARFGDLPEEVKGAVRKTCPTTLISNCDVVVLLEVGYGEPNEKRFVVCVLRPTKVRYYGKGQPETSIEYFYKQDCNELFSSIKKGGVLYFRQDYMTPSLSFNVFPMSRKEKDTMDKDYIIQMQNDIDFEFNIVNDNFISKKQAINVLGKKVLNVKRPDGISWITEDEYKRILPGTAWAKPEAFCDVVMIVDAVE